MQELMQPIHARHILISGRVQGVGFRPFVNRMAQQFALTGWVRNVGGQVEIVVEGSATALQAFQTALITQSPPLAEPAQPQIKAITVEGHSVFSILTSQQGNAEQVHIPPDYFVCADCLAEMHDPQQRRYRYPFINCTQCGPRYTLIDRLPYDRPHTAMADFPLCPACFSEYSNPLDRRYHAQPLACEYCGPQLQYRQPGRADVSGNELALAACLQALKQGLIIAVKGVGGYHLLCDATDTPSVHKLRQRKARPDKPLAVLLPWHGADGLDWVLQLAEVDAAEIQSLSSPLRPIVLVKKRPDTLLSPLIAPGLAELGMLLPYSPLHYLLADAFAAPLVATSANLSGEPVLTEAEQAESRLIHIADAFLHHNRPIRRPADDSVLRRIAGKTRPIRIGRGLAPIERQLAFKLKQPVLAVGADLKNTIALGFADHVVISPHIGNHGSLRSIEVFQQVIFDLQNLYGVIPEAIIYDAHPAYFSSRWAKNQALPVIPVYHHYAHASALIGEHAFSEQSIVFTWDGVGYGADGTLWGGEALLGKPGNWRRVASFKPFYLPGGEKASRESWRCAWSLCWQQGIAWPDGPTDTALLQLAWQRRINSPQTSSVGRLFDAAAALIGIARQSSYEGHAAMQLEAISSAGAVAVPLPLATYASGVQLCDWGPLLPVLLDTQLSPAERGSIFHASLALALADQASLLREQYGINTVGLSGGVFQNRLLTERAVLELNRLGFNVLLHEHIPSGDGGISFGQLIEAGSQVGA